VPDILGSVIASVDLCFRRYHPIGYLPYGKAQPQDRSGSQDNGSMLESAGCITTEQGTTRRHGAGFCRTDRIGYAGGMHLYAYVGNDPLNLVDPYGNCPQCVVRTSGWRGP
jgi:RHS repeat-associated protein